MLEQFRRILELSGVSLLETTMPEIYSYKIPSPGIAEYYSNEDELKELFYLFYELEYKYGILNTSKTYVDFMGSEERRVNTVKIIENTLSKLCLFLSKTFINVFKRWLDLNNIENKKIWAKSRIEDFSEVYGFEELPHIIEQLYIADSGNKKFLDYNRIASKLNEMKVFKQYLEAVKEDMKDEEEIGKTEEIDLLGELDLILGSYNSLSELISSIKGYDEDLAKDILEELYREICYYSWRKRWVKVEDENSIEKTFYNLKKIYNNLLKIKDVNVRDKFVIINFAINAVHQTGDMLEYYSHKYGESFNKNFFSNLSRLGDISLRHPVFRTWEKELKDIGAVIKPTPRYSKFPITSLIKNAKYYDNYEDFEKSYTFDINHGYYWHFTYDPSFKISEETGPTDMSSMAFSSGPTEKGALMVTSHFENWDFYYNQKLKKVSRPYVVLLDLSDIDPNELKQVGRGFGNEVFVRKENAKKIKIIGIYDRKEAMRINHILKGRIPKSEEALKKIWEYSKKQDKNETN
jgi:hypothetical protein